MLVKIFILQSMKETYLHYNDSGKLLEGIAEFLNMLNVISEDEAINELRNCEREVLVWILNDIAIPNFQYDLANLVMKILKDRGCNNFQN